MRRELTDQAEAMARQRVQHLGEELRTAGLLPEADDDLPVAVVRGPGRHARSQPVRSVLSRAIDVFSERIPFAPQHVTVLVALSAVVLVVVAWVRISESSAAMPVPRAHTSQPIATASPGGLAGATESASPGSVVVDVAGKVRRPGVITLPAGSRVIDAIRRAGGARGSADLTSLNLARVLVDGEQVLVGGPVAAAAGTGTAAAAPADGGQISLNQATLEQLETLPGVGPVTAQKILDYRTAHGPFGSVDDLLDVDGIGQKTLDRLAPHLVP
jgi:competence protein ComEA